VEEHYLLTPPDVLEAFGAEGRRELPPATWARSGPECARAAATLLQDATGRPASPELAVAFVSDVLDRLSAREPLVLTVAELSAWRLEREGEVAAGARRPMGSLGEMMAQVERDLMGGPRPGWLAMYRTVHGPPDIA
jgi:hypothetical protein